MCAKIWLNISAPALWLPPAWPPEDAARRQFRTGGTDMKKAPLRGAFFNRKGFILTLL
jgi:hypothetical protein